MLLEKNQTVTLTITALSNDGNGVGHIDGFAVFVPFTAPADICLIKIVKIHKTYAFGIVEKILTPSPSRTSPLCNIYGKCGGCCFQHLTYQAELTAKEQFVRDAMQRLGNIEFPVSPILASPNEWHYRNKAQYPLYQDENGMVRAGFYAGRSHRIIPCENCLLQPDLLNAVAHTVCNLFTKYAIPIYNELAHKGLVRHLYLRHAIETNTLMVCFVCNGRKLPHAKEICSELLQVYPQISSIVLNVNTQKTNVITGTECITLHGTGLLEDNMSGVPVSLSPLSFYQVNTLGANLLYTQVRQMANPTDNDIVLDLYCGAGTIGLSMAKNCKRLIGVEIVPQAIESAKQNAACMGIQHAEFRCADAGTAAVQLAKEGLHPDIILLDPPRKGCDEATKKAVLQMQPKKIVMVSCNASTAARDSKDLSAEHYEIQKIQPVDMFPHTKHVECVCLLTRTRG